MVRVLARLAVSAATLHAQLPAAGTWKTDLSKKSIALSELRAGGPPKDGIPTINNPRFTPRRSMPRIIQCRSALPGISSVNSPLLTTRLPFTKTW